MFIKFCYSYDRRSSIAFWSTSFQYNEWTETAKTEVCMNRGIFFQFKAFLRPRNKIPRKNNLFWGFRAFFGLFMTLLNALNIDELKLFQKNHILKNCLFAIRTLQVQNCYFQPKNFLQRFGYVHLRKLFFRFNSAQLGTYFDPFFSIFPFFQPSTIVSNSNENELVQDVRR